jgi:predicted extracellular nuclease
MPASRTHTRGRLVTLISLALAFTGLQALVASPVEANPGGTELVIKEVYGAGGNAGAVYNADFVELYNPTAGSKSLNGLFVQYRSAGGGVGGTQALPNVSIAAGSHYLVQMSAAGATGTALPTPDLVASPAINMAAAGGQVILGTATTYGAGNLAGAATVTDMVGATGATSFETATTTAAATATQSNNRNATGADTDSNAADFTLAAPTPTAGTVVPTPLSLTQPGNQANAIGDTVNFTPTAGGGQAPYTWSATGLPAGLGINPSTGAITGSPTTVNVYNPQVTVTDSTGGTPQTDSKSFTWTITATTPIIPIATLQGTGARSTYAGAGNAQGTDVVTTEGVITGVYKLGWANSGSTKTCGLCGFTIQTGGADATPGASDGIFVYAFSSFTGLNSTGGTLAPGQSVRVTGKISEFSVGGDTGSLTELNLSSGASSIVAIPDQAAPVAITTLPTTPATREEHESEIANPTDVLVADNFNFETTGELGLASGNALLKQPNEICPGLQAACITAAQDDIRARGWFTDDASTTNYLTSSTFYNPQASANSDVPLPFMDATHSARVGAKVTFPAGKPAVIGYGAKKWYLYPQRSVVSQTENGAPDLGTDVITFQDTRALNLAPANVGGSLKIATYNVENYFNYTMEQFAADNPYYACEYDNDRAGNHILAFQCTSPQAIPDQFDPLTGAPTHYTSGLVSAPRGAARDADLARQTSKIVNAINGLGADVVSLEELGNPNKLRKGVTNGPLNPDPNKVDSGFGTPIAWRDETINYLVTALNNAAGAGTWSFVASPEESTDATSVNHMCSTVNADGTTIQPPQTNGTCSWASGQDVIRSGFLYKKATVVPVGQADLDLPGSSAPIPSPFDNAREPLAQFFKPVGHPNSDGFAVIVNHFKSKGDSSPAATGGNANDPLAGAFNLSRTQQAKELVRFANEFAAKWNTTKVFLVGDFNAYTGEDPIQAILHPTAGTDTLNFDVVESNDPKDTTYVFTTTVDGVGYGGAGSLDHVLASADARTMITGTDVWEINANE